jgi:lipopolysaccharide/colanic/teichoic acid biosynthesis glycosyltransferase
MSSRKQSERRQYRGREMNRRKPEETRLSSRTGATKAAPGIYSPHELQDLIKEERARSDRMATEFSVVVFEVKPCLQNGDDIVQFIQALRRRIRQVDRAGWFGDGCIGVLLPYTSHEGAWRFAVDFEQKNHMRMAPPPFSVFTYPEHWYDSNNGSGHPGPAGRHRKHSEGAANRQGLPERDLWDAIALPFPAWKRVFDVVGSVVLLVICSPVLLVVCLYIKLVSPGPVLFRQERIGWRGRPFTFLKIRTMHTNNDQTSHKVHLKQLINSDQPMEKLDADRDPRILFGARVLRRACIDELPQLINVLRGEMSLVGPRPCLPYEAEEYLRWHKNRFDTRPGMTGLWQVSGKNNLTFKQMIRMDISYCRGLSWSLDVKIVMFTPVVVLGLVLDAVLKRIRREMTQPAPMTVGEPLGICQVLERLAERP